MTHQKKPHVHADMIKAKADDVSLVVFTQINEWFKLIKSNDVFHNFSNYFLCLPKHEEAALNMLNGGQVQVKTAVDWAEWLDVVDSHAQQSWHPEGWYMCDEWESRIKPKKEKRWIGVFRNDNGFMQNTYSSYESIEELKESVYAPNGFAGWQFIEIEFEV